MSSAWLKVCNIGRVGRECSVRARGAVDTNEIKHTSQKKFNPLYSFYYTNLDFNEHINTNNNEVIATCTLKYPRLIKRW